MEKNKAMNLLHKAHESGCWGVKFQYRSDDFFASNDEMGSTLIRDELKKSNLDENWIPELIDEARTLNLKIGFSFFREKDLDLFFANINEEIDFIKIPSPEFRNISLINRSKQYSDCVMVSFGGGSEDEIFDSIKKSNFRRSDVLLHCISNYPTALGNQQLDFLARLKDVSKASVGYSSHDEEWEVNLLTIKYGIEFIEMHICESKSDIGLDISTSKTVDEFKKLIRILNNYNNIISCDKRIPNQGEVLNVRNLGTSLYCNKNISAGNNLDISDFIEKSPRVGISKIEFINLKSKKLKKEIRLGDPLLAEHFNEKNLKLEKRFVDYLNRNKISIPVRLHDFKDFIKILNSNYNELHLSYKEIYFLSKNGFSDLISIIDKNYHISIHLPDYISKDELINPFSNNKKIADMSIDIINICSELSDEIKIKTEKDCLILGSFSMNPFENKEIFYSTFKKFTEKYASRGTIIIAQWLPKKKPGILEEQF